MISTIFVDKPVFPIVLVLVPCSLQIVTQIFKLSTEDANVFCKVPYNPMVQPRFGVFGINR